MNYQDLSNEEMSVLYINLKEKTDLLELEVQRLREEKGELKAEVLDMQISYDQLQKDFDALKNSRK